MKIIFRMNNLLPVCTLLLAAGPATAAINWDVEHSWQTKLSYGREQFITSQLESSLMLDPIPQWSTQVTTRLLGTDHQLLHNQQYSLTLREGWLSYYSDYWQITAGKQLFNWSLMDGLSSFQLLSPQDLQQFVLVDYNETALGQWAISLAYFSDISDVELVAIPQPLQHTLADDDQLFAMIAPRFRFGFDRGLGASLPHEEVTSKRWLFGAKATRYFQGFDLVAGARSGPDFEPTGTLVLDVAGAALELRYPTRDTLFTGISGHALGAVWRSELLFNHQRSFNTNTSGQLSISQHDQIQWGVGVDFDAPLGTFATVQAVYDKILVPLSTMVRPDRDFYWSAVLQRSFYQDSVSGKVKWYGSSSGDGLLRVSSRYDWSDALSMQVSSDHFYGTSHGYFGQFADRDQLSAQVSWLF